MNDRRCYLTMGLLIGAIWVIGAMVLTLNACQFLK